jgi:hypothetical protein
VTPTAHVQLAGKLADLGNSWLSTLGTWGDKGLQVGLTAIVVITFVRKLPEGRYRRPDRHGSGAGHLQLAWCAPSPGHPGCSGSPPASIRARSPSKW